MPLIHTALIILAVSAVGIADVFLKKTQSLGSMGKAILSPWMLGALALYLFQIFFFTYLFLSGAKLINIGIMQTVLYALIVIFAGIIFFGESLSSLQILGITLALLGVILLHF
jgi:drug/metabolite transporter (DMT)-like permease